LPHFFLEFVETKNNYCVLQNSATLAENTAGHDVDLLVRPVDFAKLLVCLEWSGGTILWSQGDSGWLFAVSSGLREFEFASNQIRHGDQVVRIPVASRFGLGRLNEAVNPFQEAVGQA